MHATRLVLTVSIMTHFLIGAASAQMEKTTRIDNDIAAPIGTVLAQAKSKPRSMSVTSPRPGVLAPLSAQECKNLGGSVGLSTVCKSGTSCTRYDENKDKHEVCISAQ